MTWWKRLRRLDADTPGHEAPSQPAFTAFTEIDRALEAWTRWWTRSEGDERDDQLIAVRRRAEKEVQKFFGKKMLRSVQLAGPRTREADLLLAADRLFVIFLGRRAAMAVTRKVYSNLP